MNCKKMMTNTKPFRKNEPFPGFRMLIIKNGKLYNSFKITPLTRPLS